MIDTIAKIKEILTAELGEKKANKKLYYVKRIYDDSLDNINNVNVIMYPAIIITDDGQQITTRLNRKIDKLLTIGLNYFDISGAGKNVQVGSSNKSITGYEKFVDDIIGIFKDKLQVAVYWQLLNFGDILDANLDGASENIKGKKFQLNILKKCF